MSKPLLSLCSVPKIASRDGWVGQTAHINLPFYTPSSGIYFFSGQEYDFPGTTAPQYLGPTINGLTKTTPYAKDCCSDL